MKPIAFWDQCDSERIFLYLFLYQRTSDNKPTPSVNRTTRSPSSSAGSWSRLLPVVSKRASSSTLPHFENWSGLNHIIKSSKSHKIGSYDFLLLCDRWQQLLGLPEMSVTFAIFCGNSRWFKQTEVSSTNLVSELCWINSPLPRRLLLHALEPERIEIIDIG